MTMCAFCRTMMTVREAPRHSCDPDGALVVSVRNLRPVLLRARAEGGYVVLIPADPQPPEDMLESAVIEAGGALNISGIYPVNEQIELWVNTVSP